MLSPSELLERCNLFRRAGGAEEIAELAPGFRHSRDACLVARNLNFACEIGTRNGGVIVSKDPRLAQVAKELGLVEMDRSRWAGALKEMYADTLVYHLPHDLTEAAKAFDAGQYPPELYAKVYNEREN